MIVSCPSCTGRFTVPDNAFAAGPRRMKCGRCDHVWRAGTPSPAAAGPRRTRAAPTAVATPPAAAETPAARIDPAAPRAPARAQRRSGGLWIGWLLLVLVIGGVVAGGWFARAWLVEMWPPIERVYTWLEITLPRVELIDVHETMVQDGDTERLVIEGTLVNRAEATLPMPAVSVLLFDSEGAPLQDWPVATTASVLDPGQSEMFRTEVAYPAGGVKPTWEVHIDRTDGAVYQEDGPIAPAIHDEDGETESPEPTEPEHSEPEH